MRNAVHKQYASIFLFPRFSVYNESTGFDRELWSTGGGGGGGLEQL